MDSKQKTGKYVSKKDQKTIRLYLQKKYDCDSMECINSEIKALEKITTNYSRLSPITKTDCNQTVATITHNQTTDSNSFNIKLQNLFSDNPQEIKQYLNPYDISDADYAAQWLEQPYQQKLIPEEQQRYRTDKGEYVRSKSELNIANMLYKMNVSYKYECPFVFGNGIIIHPDFTLLNVRNRKEMYWEHRGMMDDRSYLKHTIQRIRDYAREGILVGDRLVITEETALLPLGTEDIRNVILSIFE